jgi:hypothetical protein
MRRFVLVTLVSAGFGMIVASSGASAVPANIAALSQLGHQNDEVIPVLGNCGRGWHRSRWGACIPGCGAGWYQPYPGAHCRPRY